MSVLKWPHNTVSEEPMRNVIAVSARDIRAYVLYKKKYTYVLYILMNK